ncbi:hypothetical protein L218DRAFT_242872 [Marasmius fiardii PR-910]|nr:hypothetical protein L218DRAFT_242872 [Marasmius fiardii PR-910]
MDMHTPKKKICIQGCIRLFIRLSRRGLLSVCVVLDAMLDAHLYGHYAFSTSYRAPLISVGTGVRYRVLDVGYCSRYHWFLFSGLPTRGARVLVHGGRLTVNKLFYRWQGPECWKLAEDVGWSPPLLILVVRIANGGPVLIV